MSAPEGLTTVAGFVAALDTMRRRGARGTGRARISLAELANRTAIPRSTVHAYLSGRSLPTPDALDAMVRALGVTGPSLGAWADALDRLAAAPAASIGSVSLDAATNDPSTGPRQLPAVPRGLVGREAELQRLDAMLAEQSTDHSPLLVAVSGAGGVGKSAMVTAWAHRHLDDFPDGQLWLDLHGFGTRAALTPAAALGRLLRAIGHRQSRLPTDVDARAELFRTAVAGRRLLIVLDNAADSAQVRRLIPGWPGCVVVVTSRAELRALAAETGAMRVRLSPLGRADGAALLGDIAGSDGMRVRLVALCAGLPLALRIVRERLTGLTGAEVSRFADDLDDRHARLNRLSLSEGGVEIGIRPVLAASYAALERGQAEVFRLLPLCLGRHLRVDTVAAGCGAPASAVRDLLDSLVGANLVERAGPDRYQVNDLVASYADECRSGEEADDVARADNRLSRHLLARAQAACSILLPLVDPLPLPLPPEIEVVPFYSAEDALDWLGNIAELVAAVAIRAVERNTPELIWPLLTRILRLLRHRGDELVLRRPLRLAAGAAAQLGRPHEEAVMWRSLGILAGQDGDFPRARVMFLRTARLALATADPVLEDLAESNLAVVDVLGGNLRQGIRRCEQKVLPLRRRLNYTRLDVYNAMATAHCMLGELNDARRVIYDGIRNFSAGAAKSTRAIAHFNASWILLTSGQPAEEALHHAREGWQTIQGWQDDYTTVLCGAVEAAALLALGRFEECAVVLSNVLLISKRSQIPESIDLLIVQGDLIAATESAEASIDSYAAAVELARRARLTYQQANSLWHLAKALLSVGDERAARARAAEGLNLAQVGEYRLMAEGCATLMAQMSA